MKGSTQSGGVKLGKLIVFASSLVEKELVPRMSYFELQIEKEGNTTVSMLVPFYLGALEVLGEIDPLVWLKLWDGTSIGDSEAIEALIESFCKYFNISTGTFAHFFVPHSQNLVLTNKYLMRDATFKDIAAVIFDFVISSQVADYKKLDVKEFLELN